MSESHDSRRRPDDTCLGAAAVAQCEEPHVHGGDFGVALAFCSRQMLLEDVRPELVNSGVLPPCDELSAGDLVGKSCGLMKARQDRDDVAFEGIELAVNLAYEMGTAAFALPGYSGDHALTYGWFSCGGSCGQSYLFAVRKIDGVWQVQSAWVTAIG